jgi:hypothetical protein
VSIFRRQKSEEADHHSVTPRLRGILLDMKKPFPDLGASARLLCPVEPGITPTPTAELSHPRVINCGPPLIAALAICGVLGGVSLFIPPFIDWDSANGFLAWRGTLMGAPNSIVAPDRANLGRDAIEFLTVWSPGQYLVPGTISLLLGVPLGIAMTLTVALALLASLTGWVMIIRAFAPRTSVAVLVVVLIGLFHYSTHAFSTYHGGEILLQAATPWLVLTGYRVPAMGAVPAALLAAGTVCLAFLAKLTGLIAVVASFAAGSVVILAFGRRITRGMIGGALGIVATLAFLYLAFFSRGPTAASPTVWSLPFKSIGFASLAPWVAGMSWSDPIEFMFFPLRDIFSMPTAYLAFLVPPTLLVASMVLFWRPQTTDERKFRLFSLCFYGVVATVFILLFICGGVISLEERHFRSAGTLLLVCALMSALTARTPRWAKRPFLVLCALMALYGLASFSYHEKTTAKEQSLDEKSWTNQRIFDAAAIDFARQAYAQEGRDALFVLPSYQIAVALPTDARVLIIDLNYEGDKSKVAGRFFGRVPGHIFVLMPNGISDTSKCRALLSAFTDYAPEEWERITFADMSIFLQ